MQYTVCTNGGTCYIYTLVAPCISSLHLVGRLKQRGSQLNEGIELNAVNYVTHFFL
jgi:hypothetical protein